MLIPTRTFHSGNVKLNWPTEFNYLNDFKLNASKCRKFHLIFALSWPEISKSADRMRAEHSAQQANDPSGSRMEEMPFISRQLQRHAQCVASIWPHE